MVAPLSFFIKMDQIKIHNATDLEYASVLQIIGKALEEVEPYHVTRSKHLYEDIEHNLCIYKIEVFTNRKTPRYKITQC